MTYSFRYSTYLPSLLTPSTLLTSLLYLLLQLTLLTSLLCLIHSITQLASLLYLFLPDTQQASLIYVFLPLTLLTSLLNLPLTLLISLLKPSTYSSNLPSQGRTLEDSTQPPWTVLGVDRQSINIFFAMSWKCA